MAQVIVTESSLENIASAIRSKLNTQDTYKPSEMAGAISQIHGDPVLEALDVRANGTYTPSSGKDGFSQAVVNVPNSYTVSDEGKVVSSGALVAQSSQGISSNGTYDTTLKNQVVVNVPNSYSASDEGKVVDNGALVSQTSRTVTENGTYDTTLKNQAIVNVPNSYSASDEGKVVDNGALVAQSSQTITENGTYDTTLKNQVTVNVSGGGGGGSKNILGGTTAPTSADGEDGDIYLQYSIGGIKNVSSSSLPTGYSGNTNTKIVCDFNVTKAQTSEYPTLFGGRPNGGNVNSSIAYSMANSTYSYNNGLATWNANNTINGAGANELVGKIAHVELSNGLFKLSADGINIEQTIPTANISNSTNILLFGHNVNGSPQSFGTTDGIIIYRFKIYESDVLIHDFVPAKDLNDVVCMHDEITDEYIYSSGTLEYIEGDTIISAYCKVNGTWQLLEGTDIDDVNTAENTPCLFVVTASSTFSASPKQPSGAFGDVAGNFWGSGGTNNWLNVNFTTPITLKKVKLANYYRVSSSTYWYSSNITVRGSNDGFATYTDLYVGTGLSQSDTQFEINLNNSNSYLEYRFIVSDSTAYAGLGRIELIP